VAFVALWDHYLCPSRGVAVGSALLQDPIDDVAAGEQFVLVPWIAARGALNSAVDAALCERAPAMSVSS